MSIDCLIIHVPKLLEWSPYQGWFSRITFVPMGVLSIAEELSDSDFQTRIVHVGVEKMLDQRWSLSNYVERSKARVVAFGMHWHPQTYDTIEAARQLKVDLPDVTVVFGGLTASFFASELLRNYSFVDAVIRGEGEWPLRQLVQQLFTRHPDLSRVENLSWRKRGKICHNSLTFWTTETDLQRWRFSSFELIEHSSEYLRLGWRLPWEPEFTQMNEPALYGLFLGRGCTGKCSWCAGSYTSSKSATGRRLTSWRSAQRIVETVTVASEYGIRRSYVCFDPQPARIGNLLNIFEALGKLRPRPILDFETFGLPDRSLINSFQNHMDPRSRLIISPETANENLRTQHRAFSFSNKELEETMSYMEKLNVRSCLFFSIGLPGEDHVGIKKTAAYQVQLRERFRCLEDILTWPLEIEPNSPWFNHPKRFRINLKRHTLIDFHDWHGQPYFELGYDTDLLTEEEIITLYHELFQPFDEDNRKALNAHWLENQRDYAHIRQLGQ